MGYGKCSQCCRWVTARYDVGKSHAICINVTKGIGGRVLGRNRLPLSVPQSEVATVETEPRKAPKVAPLEHLVSESHLKSGTIKDEYSPYLVMSQVEQIECSIRWRLWIQAQLSNGLGGFQFLQH